MNFLTWLGKFIFYYKNRGFWWLFRHIIINLVHYRKWVVIETEINENTEMVEAKIPVNIRLLLRSEYDIDKLTRFWPDIYSPIISSPHIIKNLITERLSAGEECMIAEYNGEIVHMNWIGFYDHHIFESYEEKRGLHYGEAISHNTFYANAYRNNQLMTAVRSRVLNYLVKNNYHFLINFIRSDNIPAVKVTKRFGGEVAQIMYYFKILGISFSFISKK